MTYVTNRMSSQEIRRNRVHWLFRWLKFTPGNVVVRPFCKLFCTGTMMESLEITADQTTLMSTDVGSVYD